jgi:hypothetical protein
MHTKFLQSCTHHMNGYAGLFQTFISMLILSRYLSKTFKDIQHTSSVKLFYQYVCYWPYCVVKLYKTVCSVIVTSKRQGDWIGEAGSR